MSLEYGGAADLPKWFKEGAKLRVKATKDLRRHGVSAIVPSWGNKADNVAWPGEVATVERVDGNGWWDWRLVFDRGRFIVLRKRGELEDFVRCAG